MTTPIPPAVPAGQPTDPAKPPVPTAPPKAAEPTTPPTTPPAGDPPKTDEPLGAGGIRALEAERTARKELEKQIAALAPLQKIAEALGGGDPASGKSEMEQITERLTKHEEQLSEANKARWRAEVAHASNLTPDQALELRGETAEELAAHATRLLTLFPTAPTAPAAPGTPRPDPSQGGQGGSGANLDTQIAEAQGKGDWRTVLKLQNQKLAKANP